MTSPAIRTTRCTRSSSEWLRHFAEHLETDAALKAQVTEILRQFLGRIDMDALVRDAWHAIQAGGAGFEF